MECYQFLSNFPMTSPLHDKFVSQNEILIAINYKKIMNKEIKMCKTYIWRKGESNCQAWLCRPVMTSDGAGSHARMLCFPTALILLLLLPSVAPPIYCYFCQLCSCCCFHFYCCCYCYFDYCCCHQRFCYCRHKNLVPL